MGDHGNTYRPVSPEYCEGLKELVRLADIITPNITEACLLTGARYKDNGWRQEELADICEKLHAFGPDKVAITGLRRRSPQGYYDSFINFVSQRRPGSGSLETTSTVTRTAGPSRHGHRGYFRRHRRRRRSQRRRLRRFRGEGSFLHQPVHPRVGRARYPRIRRHLLRELSRRPDPAG